MTQTSRQKKTMNGCERKREKKCCFKFLQWQVCVGMCGQLSLIFPLQLSNELYISGTEHLPLCPLRFSRSLLDRPATSLRFF